jgi:hypothetical protein
LVGEIVIVVVVGERTDLLLDPQPPAAKIAQPIVAQNQRPGTHA